MRLCEELGRGAMGVVYKASDPTIGRLVAIKVLSLDSSPEPAFPDLRDSFLREARAAGRLSHPGIVTIHDALGRPGDQEPLHRDGVRSGPNVGEHSFQDPPLSPSKNRWISHARLPRLSITLTSNGSFTGI